MQIETKPEDIPGYCMASRQKCKQLLTNNSEFTGFFTTRFTAYCSCRQIEKGFWRNQQQDVAMDGNHQANQAGDVQPRCTDSIGAFLFLAVEDFPDYVWPSALLKTCNSCHPDVGGILSVSTLPWRPRFLLPSKWHFIGLPDITATPVLYW